MKCTSTQLQVLVLLSCWIVCARSKSVGGIYSRRIRHRHRNTVTAEHGGVEVHEVFKTDLRPPAYGVDDAAIDRFLKCDAECRMMQRRRYQRRRKQRRPTTPQPPQQKSTSTTTTARTTLPTNPYANRNPDYTHLFTPSITATKYEAVEDHRNKVNIKIVEVEKEPKDINGVRNVVVKTTIKFQTISTTPAALPTTTDAETTTTEWQPETFTTTSEILPITTEQVEETTELLSVLPSPETNTEIVEPAGKAEESTVISSPTTTTTTSWYKEKKFYTNTNFNHQLIPITEIETTTEAMNHEYIPSTEIETATMAMSHHDFIPITEIESITEEMNHENIPITEIETTTLAMTDEGDYNEDDDEPIYKEESEDYYEEDPDYKDDEDEEQIE